LKNIEKTAGFFKITAYNILSEGRGQRAEGRGQKAEVRNQRSEGRGQRTEVRGRGKAARK